ncbi:Transcriptional regulator, IclR family [Candidatus Paraburkholderia kirkii]|nr:Transcriptional regulator, IclR family [Candidatus Paraburkholderia kirkii]
MIGARDRLDVIVLETCASRPAGLDLNLSAGTRLRIASSPMGWAMLAALPELERFYLLGNVERKTEREWPLLRRRITEGISQVHNTGYCMSLGEWEAELAIVAAPLVIADRTPLVFLRASAGARAWAGAHRARAGSASRRGCAVVAAAGAFRGRSNDMSNAGEARGITLTVECGLEVLSAFHAERAPLSNAELVRRTGLSKATVSRLMTTLIRIGFLRRAGGVRLFELGAGALSIGHAYLETSPVTRTANPYLQELADKLDVCVALAVPISMACRNSSARRSSRNCCGPRARTRARCVAISRRRSRI